MSGECIVLFIWDTLCHEGLKMLSIKFCAIITGSLSFSLGAMNSKGWEAFKVFVPAGLPK